MSKTKPAKVGILYIIQNTNYPDIFKIGKTCDMRTRLYSYNDGNPVDCMKVYYMSEPFKDALKYERLLIKALGTPSFKLEWYNISLLSRALMEITKLECLEGALVDEE